jgi:hypothetical protein
MPWKSDNAKMTLVANRLTEHFITEPKAPNKTVDYGLPNFWANI